MRRAARRAGFGLSVVLTVLLTGCASRGPVPAPVPPAAQGDPDLWKLYAQAVETAKVPRPSAISTALVPIVHSTPGLRWDEQGRVLISTWPTSLDEQLLSLAQISRRRCDDRLFVNENLPSRLHRRPNVVFTDKCRRTL